MGKATAEILEGDVEEDLATLILELCGVDYIDFISNNRILTRERFQANFSKIVKIVKSHPYQRIDYIILGYLILITGSKLPDHLKVEILNASEWFQEKGLWNKELELERCFYLEDFQKKIRDHKEGKISHLVSLKNSNNLDFSLGIIGLEDFNNAFKSKKIFYVKHINLDACDLKTIPNPVFKLKYLETLSLEHNHLSEIPEEIEDLIFLKRLFLDYNELVSLPSSIGSLRHLEGLFLNHNYLVSVPESLLNIPSLKELYIRNN